MITFEEAVQKAKELKPNIDGGTEWENGWVFSNLKEAGNIGGPSPVVILKKNGEAVNMPEFIIEGSGKMIKDFDLKG